jgi:Ion channel
MLSQVAVGSAIFALCVAFHAWAMLVAVRVLQPRLARAGQSVALVSTMVAVVCTLALAHVAEVGLWAAGMAWVGAVGPEEGPLYFAFVSYTTLGYGDVLIAAREWRLLGPAAAMNGILLFGWSTAVIVHVLADTVRRARR